MQRGPGDTIELGVRWRLGISTEPRSPFGKLGEFVTIEPVYLKGPSQSRLAPANSSSKSGSRSFAAFNVLISLSIHIWKARGLGPKPFPRDMTRSSRIRRLCWSG